jgi:hypothetical protein
MRIRWLAAALLISQMILVACGDDDDSSAADKDAGTDGSAGESGSAGSGGRGGRGGSGDAGRSGDNAAGAESDVAKYAIGGSVTGLTGSGLVLRNNGGDDLTVNADGDFEFASRIASGADYDITVATPPQNPTQRCVVSNGTGKVASEDVRDVAVSCSEVPLFKVRGSIEGLTSPGLVLKFSGGQALSASGNHFEFPTGMETGSDYEVIVDTQPSDQVCAVDNASGQIGSADVMNVVVKCHGKAALVVAPGVGRAIATWNDVGSSSYTLKLTTSATCDLETTTCPGYVELTNVKSPATIPNLTNGTPYYFQLTANYPGAVRGLSNKLGTRPNRPLLDGDVNALAAGPDGVTFAGGAFTSVYTYSGSLVALDKQTGIANVNPSYAILEGVATSVAADGFGGLYVGGANFGASSSITPFLAHIKADGQLDTTEWRPLVTSSNPGGVQLAVHKELIYVYGNFNLAFGVGPGGVVQRSRPGFAAFRRDGSLVEEFNPSITGSTLSGINAVAFIGDDVLVGGSFTSIGGGTQANLALLDGQTGASKPWAANANGVVSTLVVDADTVYVAGPFTMIGGQARSGFAALHASGDTAGQATDWNPAPNGAVQTIAAANGTVYIGGAFTSVGSTARARVAAIDAATAEVKEWSPTVSTTGFGVVVIKAFGDIVYIGGDFTEVNGMPRHAAAAVSGSGSGALTDWNPNLGGTPSAYASSFELAGDAIVAAGTFAGIGGVPRPHLAAFKDSGELTDWNPGANGDIYALAAMEDRLFVGGAFTSLSDKARNRIGAVSADGTVDDSFDPNADANVLSLAVSGNNLYAGGAFANVGGQPRVSIAALDVASGAATAWNPGSNNTVRALSIQGNTLYAGGNFTQFGKAGDANTPTSALRSGLAAVPLDSDFATAWNPGVMLAGTQAVRALATTADTVYAGGLFSSLGGMTRAGLAEIDASGTLTAFAPNLGGTVNALAVDGSTLHVGGDFASIGAANTGSYAAFDNGALRTSTAHSTDAAVQALVVRGDSLYVGRVFASMPAAFGASNFAKFPK